MPRMETHRTRFLLILFTISYSLQLGYCSEFEVGERAGWVVPPPNDTAMYNEWASRKRFQVGDTIWFKYKKDSVMEVNERDYKECKSTRPKYFSNNGNTVFTLDRSGFFYFISGATGHCEKGQSMVVWVMAEDRARSTSGGVSLASDADVFSCGLLIVIMTVVLMFA